MKILIIQLAPCADILISYPVLNSLRKQFPLAQVDLVVRGEFRQAVARLFSVNCVYPFHSGEFLAPLLEKEVSPSALTISDGILNEWIDQLRDHDYDRVINLTFSAMSSYVTHAVARPFSVVAGYSRLDDGHFALTDEMSRYFYAHVGPGQTNQRSIAELFCHLAQVPEDIFHDEIISHAKPRTHFDALTSKDARISLDCSLPVGTDESLRRHFVAFVRSFAKEFQGEICLVSSGTETGEVLEQWREIWREFSPSIKVRVDNRVGRTTVDDLFTIVDVSTHVIAFEGVLAQLAFLTRTPSFIFTSTEENFYETAPRVAGTVVYQQEIFNVGNFADEIAHDVLFQLRGADSRIACAQWTNQGWYHADSESIPTVWKRGLLDSLYFGSKTPDVRSSSDLHQALTQLSELGSLAIFQIDHLHTNGNLSTQAQILERIDETIAAVSRAMPAIQPLVLWLNAQKLSVGPAREIVMLNAFKMVYRKFVDVCDGINQEKLDGALRVG